MTTNQKIDGVPRELLERLLIAVTQNFATIGEVRELRALLDAKPSVPQQLEPVTMDGITTIREYVANSVPEDQIGDDWTKGYEECKRRIRQMFQQPVNAGQPAPVAVVLPERSPQDYAIEHAEYMAKSVDNVLAKFQAYGLALLAVDEGGDDGEGELLENIDSTRGDLQESLVDLRSMVYEFRKRAAKSR